LKTKRAVSERNGRSPNKTRDRIIIYTTYFKEVSYKSRFLFSSLGYIVVIIIYTHGVRYREDFRFVHLSIFSNVVFLPLRFTSLTVSYSLYYRIQKHDRTKQAFVFSSGSGNDFRNPSFVLFEKVARVYNAIIRSKYLSQNILVSAAGFVNVATFPKSILPVRTYASTGRSKRTTQ